MSWSINVPHGSTVQAARDAVNADPHAPQAMKQYVMAGIQALAQRHGEDALVDVTAHGHVVTSPDSYEVTSATIVVQRH